MKSMPVLVLAACLAGPAMAQTKPLPPVPVPGSASVATQLRALHYGNIRDLRRGPDGRWTGKATQNGIERTVTVNPKGVVTAR